MFRTPSSEAKPQETDSVMRLRRMEFRMVPRLTG